MKKWLSIILLFQLLSVACFDDESNKEMRFLNPIMIENVDLDYGSYSLYMGDTLRIEPLIYCEGVPDARLSYEWKLFGGTLVPTVIDSTMYLDARIVAPPTPNAYTLRLTVKDETTGICRIETFSVYVLSPFGEGLIVADSKDGADSDLSLVISKLFSPMVSRDDNRVRVFKDVWSQSNGSRLTGRVLDLQTTSYGTNRSLTVVTTDHMYRADYYDYFNIPGEFDADMFFVAPSYITEKHHSAIFGKISMTGTELLCLDGYVSPRGVQHNNRRYDYTFYPSRVPEYNVTHLCSPNYYPTYGFDNLGKRMLFFSYGDCWAAKDQISSSKFDVNNLKDYEPLFLGEMSQGPTLLAREMSTGAYKGLVMKKERRNSNDYSRSVFDFSAATEIENARFFSLNPREDVIYYATESRLYTTPTAHINSKVQWEAATGQGERITGIKVYNWYGGVRDHEQLDYEGNPQKETWSSTNRLILITTYNETTREGKVHCIPIVTLGIGELEKNENYHVELSGFGEILGVYKQVK